MEYGDTSKTLGETLHKTLTRPAKHSKTLGKTLVIGEETRRTIENKFSFEYIDSITVKGKTEKIKVYTIL